MCIRDRSKTLGHHHIVNFNDRLSFIEYIERLEHIGADKHFIYCTERRGYGRLWCHDLNIYPQFQLFVENDRWVDAIGAVE